MDTRYRETSGGSGTDDEKSGDSCSDSDEPYALWKKKRPKVQSLPVHRQEADTLPMKTARNRGSKNSNIWKSVLTEQSSNDISSSFGAVGMKYYMSRWVLLLDFTLQFSSLLHIIYIYAIYGFLIMENLTCYLKVYGRCVFIVQKFELVGLEFE